MITNNLESYRSLLIIRRDAKRRDTLVTGVIFLLSFIALIALGMLGLLTGISSYLVTALVVCFGLGYLTTWVKLETIKGSIEMIDNLLLKT